jgi:hypothetical protein
MLQHDPNRPEDVLKLMRTRMGSAGTIRQTRCGIGGHEGANGRAKEINRSVVDFCCTLLMVILMAGEEEAVIRLARALLKDSRRLQRQLGKTLAELAKRRDVCRRETAELRRARNWRERA